MQASAQKGSADEVTWQLNSPKNSFSCYEFYDMIKFRFQANDLVGMAMPLIEIWMKYCLLYSSSLKLESCMGVPNSIISSRILQ
jgi:hypothetical protein